MSERTEIPDATSIENRIEYQLATTDELEITTDLIDEVLLYDQMPDEDHKQIIYDSEHPRIAKSYSYIESGLSSGWVWPLTETQMTITYTRNEKPATSERYQIGISRTVHQTGFIHPPLMTTYTIEYFGQNHESSQATIDTNDLTNDSPLSLETRPMTAYDNESALFNEIGHIYDQQLTQNHEKDLLDKIDHSSNE